MRPEISAYNDRRGTGRKMPRKLHRSGRNAGKTARTTQSCGASDTSLVRAFKALCWSIAFIRVDIPLGEFPVTAPEGVTVGCMVAVVIRIARSAIRQSVGVLMVLFVYRQIRQE